MLNECKISSNKKHKWLFSATYEDIRTQQDYSQYHCQYCDEFRRIYHTDEIFARRSSRRNSTNI